MTKNRLEAFSDGVIAIIITIMVLELKAPHGTDIDSLKPLLAGFISYVLSFLYVAIYWNNHHHLLQAAQRVNGRVLWANMLLLFFLSLIPFVTRWVGENKFGSVPVALYGLVLFCAGLAYYILERQLISVHGKNSTLMQALGKDWKGLTSVTLYALAIALAFRAPKVSILIYLFVALLWLKPEPRIEKRL